MRPSFLRTGTRVGFKNPSEGKRRFGDEKMGRATAETKGGERREEEEEELKGERRRVMTSGEVSQCLSWAERPNVRALLPGRRHASHSYSSPLFFPLLPGRALRRRPRGPSKKMETGSSDV